MVHLFLERCHSCFISFYLFIIAMKRLLFFQIDGITCTCRTKARQVSSRTRAVVGSKLPPVPGRAPATTTAKEPTNVAPPTVVAEPVPLSDPPA